MARRTVQFYPNVEELRKLKAGLPTFQPHNVTSLLLLPAEQAKEEAGRVTSSVINEQLDELLNALGVDRATPDRWRRGFQLLAMIHHGTGHFTFNRPAPPNRNAAKLTPELDRELYEFVKKFGKEGVGQTAALRMIAKDPEKCRRLKLPSNSHLQTPDDDLRFGALRKRWTRISKMAPPGSLLVAVVGNYPVNGSEKDKANWRPNLAGLPPLASLGKSNASTDP